MTGKAFGPTDRSKRRMKVLLTGSHKTGKTYAALTFPRVALIDSEGGWEYIDDLPDPAGLSQTKDLDEVLELVTAIRADNGATYDTLMLDSVTVLYDVATARLRRAQGAKFGPGDRALINERMKELYNALTQLPVHLVVTAREDDVYLVEGTKFTKTGRGVDADKSILYPFDFIVRMDEHWGGKILFARGSALPQGYELKRVNFEALEAALRPGDLRNAQAARAFFMHWRAQGLSDSDILNALQVDKISQWTAGRAAADAVLATLKPKQTTA